MVCPEGNDMTKKATTDATKQTRSRSRARGVDRKKARVDAQHKRMLANRARRAAGEPVPWEVAQHERAVRRVHLQHRPSTGAFIG